MGIFRTVFCGFARFVASMGGRCLQCNDCPIEQHRWAWFAPKGTLCVCGKERL